jgi:hypothetical protein
MKPAAAAGSCVGMPLLRLLDPEDANEEKKVITR